MDYIEWAMSAQLDTDSSMDAGEVKIRLNELVANKSGLGKVARLPISTTTAENLAGWMFGEFVEGLRLKMPTRIDLKVVSVSVWETPTAFATAVME
jgi:hypothetical protein